MNYIKLIVTIVFLTNSCFSQKLYCNNYDGDFKKYSKRYFGPSFDWKIFKAQAFVESNLNPDAVSWVGARGIMQIMPRTYKELTLKNPQLGNIKDPHWSIAAGIQYNRIIWKKFVDKPSNEKLRFMFASYNAGPTTIKKAEVIAIKNLLDPNLWNHIKKVAPMVPKWRYSETLNYVDRIEVNYLKLTKTNNRKNKNPVIASHTF